MSVLTGPRKGRPEFAVRPLPQAHFVERQLVHSRLGWEDGTRLIMTRCPEATHRDHPHEWWELLTWTHAPGRVPPGNGPYFIPEWALDDFKSPEIRPIVSQLKRAGFREAVVHVVMLPHSNDYLASARRAAGSMAWNVNPLLYRCYLYPTLGEKWTRPLRRFTTPRWRASGLPPRLAASEMRGRAAVPNGMDSSIGVGAVANHATIR